MFSEIKLILSCYVDHAITNYQKYQKISIFWLFAISHNVCVYLKFSSRLSKMDFDYQITLDILNSTQILILIKG